jgi:hypothetical protein
VNALRQVQIQCEWLGNEEARRLVGLSRTTLYRLIKTGESGYQGQRELTPRSSPPTAPPRSRPTTPAPEHGCLSSTATQRKPPGSGAAKTDERI